MFSFLKQVFVSPRQAERVREKELKRWISKQIADAKKKAEDESIPVIKSINEELDQIALALDELAKAKLHNPNIPMKEKQFMEGNRDAYIKKVRHFVSHVDTMAKNYDELASFCKTVEEELTALATSTYKPYKILQHFFDHEASRVSHSIATLDKECKKLSVLLISAKIGEMRNIESDILKIRRKKKSKLDAKKNLMLQTKKAAELDSILISSEKKINHFLKTDLWMTIQEEKAKKEQILDELKHITDELVNHMAVLERALRKYSKIALDDESLLALYLEHPMNALVTDEKLHILQILKRIESNINSGHIELDSHKIEKTVQKIAYLDEKYLSDIRNRYRTLHDEMYSLEQSIKKSGADESYEKLLGEKRSQEHSKQLAIEEITRLKEKIDSIKIKKRIRVLEKKIKESLQREIQIEVGRHAH
jgi:hypothetical protein